MPSLQRVQLSTYCLHDCFLLYLQMPSLQRVQLFNVLLLCHTYCCHATHTHKLMNTCSCLPTHSGRKRGAPSLGMCPGQAAACGAGDHTQGAHQCCLGSSVVVCAVMFAVCRAPLNSVLKSTRKERISAALAAQ
jgi:hypothetical protein